MFRLCFAAFFPLLTGCAAFTPASPRDALTDEVLRSALEGVLCRVEPGCQRIRLYVVDRDFPQAEMFPDGRLLINIGMLTATRSESEIAFVLAHEVAHRRLRHLPAKSVKAKTDIELQADAFALDRLRDSGLQPYAGHRLLVRLLELAREDAELNAAVWAAERGSHEDGTSPDRALADDVSKQRAQEGLAQLEQRIQAIQALTRSEAELPATAGDRFWHQQLLRYREEPVTQPRPERAFD